MVERYLVCPASTRCPVDEGHVDGSVGIVGTGAALLRRHADDGELGALDADGLPEGVGAAVRRVAEQVGGGAVAEDRPPWRCCSTCSSVKNVPLDSVTLRTVS